MTGRELESKLNYIGMERSVRQLVVKDNLAPLEKVAVMSTLEICNLIVENYFIAFVEDEKIGLVKFEDKETYLKIVQTLSR